MHHTFYGNGKTLCGRRINDPNLKGKVTGIDSLVTCGNCVPKLTEYRKHFPQASNLLEPFYHGEEVAEWRPVMEGGAR